MTTFRFSLLAALISGAATAQNFEPPTSLPSGLEVQLIEVIEEYKEAEYGLEIARFRFFAPSIASGNSDQLEIANDMQFICESFAKPALAANSWQEANLVISMSSEPITFGESAPNVTQFFYPFRLEKGSCIPEDF